MRNNNVSSQSFGNVIATVPKIESTFANKKALVDLRRMFKMNGTNIQKLDKDTLEFTNKNAPDEHQADIWTQVFLNKLGVKAEIKNDPRSFADKARDVKILNNHLIGEEIFD